MNLSRKKALDPTPSGMDAAERRRIARIVHDERGNASVKWHDAPAHYKRQVLELESDDSHKELSLEVTPKSFDPYSRHIVPEPKKGSAPRTDLRKLSEWIKMMREREEQKAKS
jgi:hypothetical protein